MSYGIGIVIVKDDLEKDLIRWDFCDWVIPITVKLYHKECKKCFKENWYPSFKNELKVTTLEKLKTAPCDIVFIIDKKGNSNCLDDRKPIGGTKLREHLSI